MKVEVSWGPRNANLTYHVAGADLEGVLRSLQNRSEWASFAGTWRFTWKGTTKAGVTSVRIEPTFSITMPSWGEYKNQPQECKNAWDVMFRALRQHEDGHRDMFEECIRKVVREIEALEAATPTEIEGRLHSAEADMQDLSDKYDTATDHGASRGVVLNITEACRSKTKTR